MYTIVDGPTLSLLLYRQLNSNGKQMGFLLGKRMEKVQSDITDLQIHTSQVHSYIYVTSFIPWPTHKCLYGRNGQIDESLMQQVLKGTEEQVVGWYSFRHLSYQMASMKEASIHKTLTHITSFKAHPEEFLFFLCSSLASRNLSTHSIDFCFMVYRNGHFTNVPTTVKNLGDTSRVDYILENSSPATSTIIQNTLGNSQKNFVSDSGEVKQIVQMKGLISSMSKGLESTQSKVNNSEAVLELLEVEVSSLRERVASLEKAEMLRTFERAEREKQREEEERIEQEKKLEAEEEDQMNKLLLDLGLAEAVQKENLEEESGAENPPSTALSIPKLEAGVNPLYVSTLSDLDGPSTSYVFSNVIGKREEASLSGSSKNLGKVQLTKPLAIGTASSASKDGTAVEVGKASKDSIQAPALQDKPKDPFDFVMHEVKSELKVKQPSRVTRSAGQKSTVNEMTRSMSPKILNSSCDGREKNVSHVASVSRIDGERYDVSTANGHIHQDEAGNQNGRPSDPTDPALNPTLPDEIIAISSSPVF